MSSFSQEMSEEIVGKWKVIRAKQLYFDCVPRYRNLEPLIDVNLEFTESGDFFYTYYGVDVLKLYNSKWYINDDIIELQSVNYEKPLKIGLKKVEENFYYLTFSSIKLIIEKVND